MKALVTGGAGFIGSHLVAKLVLEGHTVTVIDSLITGDRTRLSSVESEVRFVEGDIRDYRTVVAAAAGADVIYHLAALPSVQRSIDDPATTNAVNVGGTINVMEAAASVAARRVVISGSSAVYGASPLMPRREDHPPDPRSPYAVSKLATELYAFTLGAIRNIDVVVLRYFNVFGPEQDPNSPYAAVVPKFIVAALRGDRPVIYGDGKQSRDFTYIDNVVAANLLAADAPDASGEVFNVGCGSRQTLLDLVQAIASCLNVRLDPIFNPPLPGDVRDSEADISKARKTLGYRPLVEFAPGIRQTISSYAAGSRDEHALGG